MKKRKFLGILLAVATFLSAVPLTASPVGAAEDTVEVSTWEELKKALEYTTVCSVVKVVKDIETKSLNGHTGLHQDNIIFMTMAMDKVLDLNGHTVNAYVKYYSEVGQGYLINVSHEDARLTIRDSVGGGALIGEFNQEFYFQFINVSGGTLVMESGTVKMLCPSKDDQYKKCAVSVSGTAIFNGGEVLTQVTSPGGEREERYLSRRLQAIRGEAGGSVTINGGTFDRVVLHSAPTPENLGKYELVVNGGFFRQSIALILVGDVYASNFDHLPMQINDAYFMRTTDKLDPCRLAISGRLQSFYDRNWDYRLLYNDIPGATFDDALSMMDDLIPHLISENGAVFTDVHDGNWYVRGNMRQWVENGGPIMIFQGTSFGVQGGIAKVISNAYGVKEVLLDGEPMEYGERGSSAPQVDTTAENEHKVTFVVCPISPMLRAVGYSYPYGAGYESSYVRLVVEDIKGQDTHHYEFSDNEDKPFSLSYPINESNVDTLTTMELQYTLMLTANGERKPVMHGYKGAKVAQWVDRSQAIEDVYVNISQPLVQGDYTSGAITADESAPYTAEDLTGYWEHDDWDLNGKNSVPATPGDKYWRFFRVSIKDGHDGYKFDKSNPPKIKIGGLNRECDDISVRVADDGRSVGVSIASRPSELVQSAWGTVIGLRAGCPIGGVAIRSKDNNFELQIKEIQRIEDGAVYNTSPSDIIDPDYTYRIKVVGEGKREMTFRNGPFHFDHTFDYYVNTCVRLRMSNDFGTVADYKETPYDTSAQAYTIDLTPEPSVTEYDSMPISVLDPVKGAVPYTEENSWYLRANNIPSIFAGSSVEWRDESNTVKMEYGEPFEEGKTYWCRVFVYESEQAVLAPNVDFYINGEKAIERTEQGGRCFERKFVIGSAGSLIGKVTSFGLETDDVFVRLYSEGSSEPAYETVVQGNVANYSIPEISSGTYIMKVSKANHVTTEITVEVGDDVMYQDAMIFLLGDINGDGDIDTRDLVRLMRYIAAGGESVIASNPDLNGDGLVTTADLIRLMKILIG